MESLADPEKSGGTARQREGPLRELQNDTEQRPRTMALVSVWGVHPQGLKIALFNNGYGGSTYVSHKSAEKGRPLPTSKR